MPASLSLNFLLKIYANTYVESITSSRRSKCPVNYSDKSSHLFFCPKVQSFVSYVWPGSDESPLRPQGEAVQVVAAPQTVTRVCSQQILISCTSALCFHLSSKCLCALSFLQLLHRTMDHLHSTRCGDKASECRLPLISCYRITFYFKRSLRIKRHLFLCFYFNSLRFFSG